MSLPLFPDEAPRVIDGPLPPVERVPYQPASATSREGAHKAAEAAQQQCQRLLALYREHPEGLTDTEAALPSCVPSSEVCAMRPYYEHAGITIYHGDCSHVIPTLSFKFDLVLTDPPYGHGEKWSGGTWAANPIYDLAFEWDATPAPAETMQMVIAAAPNAIVWGGNYYTMPPSRCWLAWVKSSLMRTMADFELAWTNLDRPAKLYREQRNPDGKRDHPTQKPLSLMRWCLALAPDAGLVLDPFMGSGTTLRAAKDCGKKAVGIEREERYCEIAAKRLAQEALPLEVA